MKPPHFLATTASGGDVGFMEKLRTIAADIILNLIGGLFGLAGLITTLPGLILIFAICGEGHLKEPANLLILALGCMTPALFLTSSILFIAHPHPKYVLLGILAVACAAGLPHALSLPGAIRLLH